MTDTAVYERPAWQARGGWSCETGVNPHGRFQLTQDRLTQNFADEQDWHPPLSLGREPGAGWNAVAEALDKMADKITTGLRLSSVTAYSQAIRQTPGACKPVSSSHRGSEGPPLALWLSGAAAPDEVAAYCQEHGITDTARGTVELATRLLSLNRPVTLSLEGDGESEEVWLIVHLSLDASWAEAYDVYDRFIDEWIGEFPPASRHRIRITYSAR